jgi:hypothetical protein
MERAALRERWLRSARRATGPVLPFVLEATAEAETCSACGRTLPSGGRVVRTTSGDVGAAAGLCLTCARRALLGWADERRAEAAAARRLARELGQTTLSDAA